MLSGHIMILVDIVGKIVKAAFASFHHEFPVALSYAYHVRFMEFPVECVVLFLQPGLPGERRIEGDSVEIILLKARVGISAAIVLDAKLCRRT